MTLLDRLKIPETRGLNLDSPEASALHAKIIREKPILRGLYTDFYIQLQERLPKVSGDVVELGSGGGFLKEAIPQALTTDVAGVPGVDRAVDAASLPFAEASVAAFVMTNVFHHIPEPQRFLSEASRCLKPGGRIIMIEPANTLFGRWIYRHFHHEDFNPEAGWSNPAAGRLTAANQALAWIVFKRDRAYLNRTRPEFSVLEMRPHTPLRYLASGGLSLVQLVPSWMQGLLKVLELILSPFHPWLGLFMTVTVEKKP